MVEGFYGKNLADLISRYYSVFEALYPDRELKLTEVEKEADVSISTISKLVNRVEEKHIFHIRLEARDRGRPAKYIKLTENVKGIIAAILAAKKPPKAKYDESTIKLLIRILKDDSLLQNVKVSAAYRLKDCCSWEGEIEGGKDALRDFFIDILEDLEDNEEKELTQTEIKIAIEYYIAFQLKDEEDLLWMNMSCYPKLKSVFEGRDIKRRKRALKALSRIYEVKELSKKQRELTQLLREKFFTADEDEGIASDCWEIIWRQADDEDREALIDKLFKMAESEEERIKERGAKHIKKIISS